MSATIKKRSDDFYVGLFSPVVVAAWLATTGAALALKAIVLAKLWGWYAVPAFGLAPVRPIFAFGLSLLLSYAVGGRDKPNKDESGWALIGRGAVGAILVLLAGWIGTFFI